MGVRLLLSPWEGLEEVLTFGEGGGGEAVEGT